MDLSYFISTFISYFHEWPLFITTFLSKYIDDKSLYNTEKDIQLVKSILEKDFMGVTGLL